MPISLNSAVKRVHNAEIVRHGDKLTLPENMKIPDAIELLKRRYDYENETVNINRAFDVFPWDGANALAEVLSDMYGWAPSVPTRSFFNTYPPKLINIATGVNETKNVPWGKFKLPNIDGELNTGVQYNKNRFVFHLSAEVKRMYENDVNKVFDKINEYLSKHSLYRGKAVKLRFRDDKGEPLTIPVVEFIETNDVDETMLIYSRRVEAAIHTNLFTPILRTKDCIENGITIKRGVLLGGTYGTGKTLAAKVASKYAVQQGITYVYVTRADELADAVEYGKQYQSPACVIFCEDIDRAMSGERSEHMDDILNIIDGIDTKSSNLIIVLTSNDMASINPAMLRPGRLDAVIEVEPPDAEGIERLLRVYGKDAIDKNTDLNEVSKRLEGCIPAVIAEVVKRAKLAQLRLSKQGTKVKNLSSEALIEAADTMSMQLRLLEPKKKAPTHAEQLAVSLKQVVEGRHELRVN